MTRVVFALALVAALAAPAAAHRASDSFLTVEVDGAELAARWDVALRDLDPLLALDADGDRALTGAELRAAAPRIAAHLAASLTLRADGAPCPLRLRDLRLAERDGVAEAVLRLAGRCAAPPRELQLSDQLLFDADPTHRGLVRVVAGGESHAGVTAPAARELRFELGASGSWRTIGAFVVEGVTHIWGGTDHVLFLLVLLLPAALARGAVVRDVAGVVTAFTVAHSVTLALSVLDVVRLPASFVEPAIAVTVALAALANLRRNPVATRWPMAFYLGLLHGFGFSSVLADLGLHGAAAAAPLVGFNLGVELGQAAIVALFLPVALALRGTWFYRRALLAGGSAVVLVIAACWTLARINLG